MNTDTTAPATMTPAPRFVVIDLGHRPLTGEAPCASCVALADPAADLAWVTGSRGATERNGEHSATVTRTLGGVPGWFAR